MPRRWEHWKSNGLTATLLGLLLVVIALVVIAVPRPLERSDRAAVPRAQSDVPALDRALDWLPADPTPAAPPPQQTPGDRAATPSSPSSPAVRDEAGEGAAADDTIARQYVLGTDPVAFPAPGVPGLVLTRDAGLSDDETRASAPAVSRAPVAEATDTVGTDGADAGPTPARRPQAATARAATGGEPQPCGASVCLAGTICCNESCGTCVVPGQSCSSLTCSMPEVPVSVLCGRNTCAIGEVCCNLSCGICVPAGATCDQRRSCD